MIPLGLKLDWSIEPRSIIDETASKSQQQLAQFLTEGSTNMTTPSSYTHICPSH